MEVDEIQQVSKFQRVCSNDSCSNDNTSNPKKIATSRGNLVLQNHVDDGGVARLYGCPPSRIVRVSRASGGKDRHSKVLTSKGLRDRRVRLSVGTAIQFYDLQDRLGYDQPSKAVEWLLKAASSSIDELPSLDLLFHAAVSDHYLMGSEKKATGNGADLEDRFYLHQNSSSNNNKDNNNVSRAKSPSWSSTSETSKGSGLSLSRSENQTKAREWTRLSGLKEKDKETDSNQVNGISENSSFTDLLTGGVNTTTTTTAAATTVTGRYPIDYFFNRHPQIPQFNIMTGDQFSLPEDSFLPTVATTATVGSSIGGELHNFNFLATSPPSSSGGAVAPGGFTRGTLQSNLESSLLPHHQRFHSSSIDGSTNLPFFTVPNATVDHFTATGGYHLSYGGYGGERHSDHHKEKSKN